MNRLLNYEEEHYILVVAIIDRIKEGPYHDDLTIHTDCKVVWIRNWGSIGIDRHTFSLADPDCFEKVKKKYEELVKEIDAK